MCLSIGFGRINIRLVVGRSDTVVHVVSEDHDVVIYREHKRNIVDEIPVQFQ